MKALTAKQKAQTERAVAQPRRRAQLEEPSTSDYGFTRHMLIPDCQVRPGVDLSHLDHVAQAIVHYKPDVVVQIGDFADLPSLSGHHEPGSLEGEGQRVKADIDCANDAWRRLFGPMHAEIARLNSGRRKRWRPRLIYCLGNHEQRIDRAVNANPKLEGILNTDLLLSPGFERHPFLAIVAVDGISYSHYFVNQHSGRPLGGSVDNMLGRIGTSFAQGHVQGFAYAAKVYPGNLTRHGIVAGSCYPWKDDYRGPQANGQFRGIVVMNEVQDGNMCIMPLTLDYLRRRWS